MSSRLVSSAVLPIAALLVLGLSGCGSATKLQACTEIGQVITDVSHKGTQQVADPAAMSQTYRDGATAIRQKAEKADGDVRTAANKVADEFDKLGATMATLAGNTSTTPQMPDITAMTTAGQELQKACS